MKLRKQFDTLAQRIFYNYLLCLSPFSPVKSDIADEAAQLQLHGLCTDIFKTLYDKPELIGIKDEPDDCFELYVCNNRKPELSVSFRNSAEVMGRLYRFLCQAALYGSIDGGTLSVAMDKKQLKTVRGTLAFLPHVGITVEVSGDTVTLSSKKYPLVFPAMRLLASNNAPDGQISGKTLFSFSMCIFDGRMDYLVGMIEREMELEAGFFQPYFKEMKNAGYAEKHSYDWCAEGPSFVFKFENGVSGVYLCFDMRKIHQIHFSLGSIIGVKAICEDFDAQPPHIKEYLYDRLNDCNNCLGCTKGGKNAKHAVDITKDGKARLLCPGSMWIGFQVEYMSHDIIKALIDFSALQAKYGVDWHKPKKK